MKLGLLMGVDPVVNGYGKTYNDKNKTQRKSGGHEHPIVKWSSPGIQWVGVKKPDAPNNCTCY